MSDIKFIETVFGTLDDKQLQTLTDGVKEMSVHLSRIDSEKEALKDIVNSISDKLKESDVKLPKKIINRIAKVYHKKSFAAVATEDNEFQTLYSVVVGKAASDLGDA